MIYMVKLKNMVCKNINIREDIKGWMDGKKLVPNESYSNILDRMREKLDSIGWR